MIGSFNIKTSEFIFNFKPSFEIHDKFNHPNATGGQWFWLVKLNRKYYGWAFRWGGSRQKETIWEIISKETFPESMKAEPIEIEVMEEWPPDKIKVWDQSQHQFQTFPWSGKSRANSELIWEAISGRGDWPGRRVLDIGCNFGFHCQIAADAGAIVKGYDINEDFITQARIINDHIAMNDVQFSTEFPKGIYDYVFYFSVHHQADPGYIFLGKQVKYLKSLARAKVFIELIVPALIGKIGEADIDDLMGGPGILKYHHEIRKIRKIYDLKGEAND
jgi:SAM-dependent methyltransferase